MLGHKCKNRQLYLITVQEEDQEELEKLSEEDAGIEGKDKVIPDRNPYFSSHASEGTFNYQTMRLRVSVGKKMLCVLIDTRNTHNFISCSMVVKLGCIMERVLKLKVMAANSEELKCKEVCRGFT